MAGVFCSERVASHTTPLQHLLQHPLQQLRPLTVVLAKLLPDAAMRRQMAAREIIFDTSSDLLDSWHAHAELELATADAITTTIPSQTPAAKLPHMMAEQRDSSVRDDSASQITFSTPTLPSEASAAKCDGKGQAGGGGGGRLSGIAPGSFLGLMLAARRRGTDVKLTDMQVTYFVADL